jgi:hypothetical protein
MVRGFFSGQEVLFAAGLVGGRATHAPYFVAGHLSAPLSGGLVQFGAGGVAGCAAPALDAGEGGDDVDVVVGVADADPPGRVEVAVRGESDRGGDLGRRRGSTAGRSGSGRRGGCGSISARPAVRAVSMRAGCSSSSVSRRTEGRPFGGKWWLQVGEVAGGGVGPRGDDMRVVVPAAAFVVFAGAEEVAQEPSEVADGSALVDLRDQLDLPALTSAAVGRWA